MSQRFANEPLTVSLPHNAPLSAVTTQTKSNLWENAGALLKMWEFTVENANDPVLITTADLALPGPHIVYVNRAFTRISGYTSDEVVGLTPRILQGPLTNRAEMRRMRAELEAGLPFVGEAINYTKGGKTYFMEWSVYGLHDEGGTLAYYVAVQRDISARKQYERQIEEQSRLLAEANRQLGAANARLATLSMTDSLTGIYNHRALHQKLSEEVSRAIRYQLPLSLLLIDVDRFKLYNDVFGHPAGDEALCEIARLLEQQGRESDIVARHGGEEFAVLLPQTDRMDALALAETLRLTIERVEWPLRSVTVSIGAATLDDFESDCAPHRLGADLVSCADKALYASKNRGRNCVS